MKILSLFDGISCAHIALDRAGIPVEQYYASEIDRYAIQVTQANYPNTVQLGDVRNVNPDNFMDVDMIVGGSPCTGFSFAGKGLNFNDPQSKLFFEYVRILKAIKPKYFLLENVQMKEEYENVISEILGEIYPECVKQKGLFSEGMLKPVMINSALVSAQNRIRNYWCNWNVTQPADRGIMLKDIIESGQTEKDKSYCIKANYTHAGSVKSYLEKSKGQLIQKIGNTNPSGNGMNGNIFDINGEAKCPTLTTNKGEGIKIGCIMVGEADNINGHGYNKRIYSEDGKAPSLAAASGVNLEPKVALAYMKWRKLTPEECEKLQTLPVGYTKYGLDNYCQELYNDYTKYNLGGDKWLLSAKPKNVIGIYLTNQQDIVINTIGDLSEPELLMADQRLIKKNSVSLKVVNENSKPLKICASCTISELKELETLNSIFEKIKYVEYVERKRLQKSYVKIIITTTLGKEMLNIPIISEKDLINMDTKSHKENILLNIEKLQRIFLEDRLQIQKLYTILIWLRKIIIKTICISAPEVNIHYCIANLNASGQNCLDWDILSLKTETIKLTSSSQRYRQCGNGWTVDVIAHIFSFIPPVTV